MMYGDACLGVIGYRSFQCSGKLADTGHSRMEVPQTSVSPNVLHCCYRHVMSVPAGHTQREADCVGKAD